MKRNRYILFHFIRIFLMAFWRYTRRQWRKITVGVPITDSTYPSDEVVGYKKSIRLWRAFLSLVAAPVDHIFLVVHKRFPRKFAPFPGRPVWV